MTAPTGPDRTGVVARLDALEAAWKAATVVGLLSDEEENREGCVTDPDEIRRREAEGGDQFTEPTKTALAGLKVSAVRMRLSRAGARAVHGSYYDPAVIVRETA